DHVLQAHRLAAARAAQDRERLSGADRQVDAAQHGLSLERLVHARELDHDAHLMAFALLRLAARNLRALAHNITISWVRKKSVTSTPIEAATTVRVVARPTPTVPPVVWSAVEQATIAISQPNTIVLSRPENRSSNLTVLLIVWR